MLHRPMVLFVLMLGFLANWFDFLGVSIWNAGSQRPKCFLRSETGPCTQFIDLYYYNAAKKLCEPFTYGGCGGNENKFVDAVTCVQQCYPSHGYP